MALIAVSKCPRRTRHIRLQIPSPLPAVLDIARRRLPNAPPVPLEHADAVAAVTDNVDAETRLAVGRAQEQVTVGGAQAVVVGIGVDEADDLLLARRPPAIRLDH